MASSWESLLGESNVVAYPWVGGRRLRRAERVWRLEGSAPVEHGWYSFDFRGSGKVVLSSKEPVEGLAESLKWRRKGYLVGDHLISDGQAVPHTDPAIVAGYTEVVHLVPGGNDRFARVVAGRTFDGGPLVFVSWEFPLGPEQEVLEAYLERRATVDHVFGLTPALDAAFRMESWRREDEERRRAEAAERRRLEEERLAVEARRREMVEKLGDGAGRRKVAVHDFAEAARSALSVGGAVYLDHRASTRREEVVVTFRFRERRFECTCDSRTLQVIDSGICLRAHDRRDGFEPGTRGDGFFTLESLPSVIGEAIGAERLVVYRHVDGDRGGFHDDDDYDD